MGDALSQVAADSCWRKFRWGQDKNRRPTSGTPFDGVFVGRGFVGREYRSPTLWNRILIVGIGLGVFLSGLFSGNPYGGSAGGSAAAGGAGAAFLAKRGC